MRLAVHQEVIGVNIAINWFLGHLPLNHPIDKAVIGFVTSGCPSPTLNKNIAMGYVDFVDSKLGTELHVDFGESWIYYLDVNASYQDPRT